MRGMLWKNSDLESLDYDLFESVVNKSGMSYKYRDGQEKNRLVYARWSVTLLTGVITAFVAVFLLFCSTLLASLKQSLLRFSIDKELNQEAMTGTAFICLLVFNLLLVGFAASVTCFIEPVSAGSGISEVKTMLNGMKIPRMLRIRTFFCKVIGTICSVAGGLPVGKEGPMIHSGAIVAAGLSQGKSSTLGYDTSFTYFAGFRNDREKRDFVACGAAAGVAAAFGSPIGGVMFVLEEGASFWNQTLTWRTLFCAMAATFTLAFFLSGMNDNLSWGTLGSHTGTFSFGSFTSSTYQVWEIPIFILMGIGGGLQGALFNSFNTHLALLRGRWIRNRGVAFFEALVIGLFVSSFAFVIPQLFGKCHTLPKVEDLNQLLTPSTAKSNSFNFALESLRRNTTACVCDSCSAANLDPSVAECYHADDTQEYPYRHELVRFFCPNKDEYNDLASLLLVNGEVAIKHLFHAPPNSFEVRNLVIFYVLFHFLACITYGLKLPSGLFIPMLLIGAAYGRLWTKVINYFTEMHHAKTVDPRVYGLIGSAAMLGGVTRMTISLTVIILECTGTMEYGLPLILTSFFARWVGNVFNEGIYDIHIHLRRVPFLDWDPPLRGSFLRVKHIMTSNPKCLRTVERAGIIFDLLVSTKHNAFPVIVEDPTFGNRFFAGVIMRKQLNVLLFCRDFCVEKPKPFSREPPPPELRFDTISKKRLRFARGPSASSRLRAASRRQKLPRPSTPEGYVRTPRELQDDFELTSPNVTESLLQPQPEDEDPDEEDDLEDGWVRPSSATGARLQSKFCLSYRDMEAHYPRYPTPIVFVNHAGKQHKQQAKLRTNSDSHFDLLSALQENDEWYTLREIDRSLWVDLTPYINQTPYVIQEEAPFTRAYRLFRSAGLRHLIVVNRHNNVRGIVTRHELQEEHCTRSFKLAKNVPNADVLYPLSTAAPPVSFFNQLKRKITRSDQVKRVLVNTTPPMHGSAVRPSWNANPNANINVNVSASVHDGGGTSVLTASTMGASNQCDVDHQKPTTTTIITTNNSA